MIKPLRLPMSYSKSPIHIIGLFCLVLLVCACNKTDNPDDVTVAFWTALAEGNLEKAQRYSSEKEVKLFDERLRNASVQVAKTKYECYKATVQTYLSLQPGNKRLFFKTVIVRDEKAEVWKVDYKRTVINVNAVINIEGKDIIAATKQFGQEITTSSGTFFKALWQAIKDSFTLFKQWLFS